MSQGVEDLAFQEAVRSIDHQRDTAGQLSQRVGTLIAGASIATSFLGATALAGMRRPSLAAWLAMALFVLTIGCCLFVLWARTGGWKFDLDVNEILERGQAADIKEVKRELTSWMEDHYQTNAGRLDIRIWVFNGAAVALGLEVLAWLAAIAWR